MQLEGNRRQVEDRPIPEKVQQVIWKGGRESFRWSQLPGLTLDFRRLVQEIKPDLIHAGPIQTCAFIAVLSGFRPILTMSWGFDLMDDVHKGKIWEFATRYTLKRSSFFISDANVTRQKAIEYGMDPDQTIVFPWGVDLEVFNIQPSKPSETEMFTLFCNRSWEPRYGVDVLARAFVKVAQQKEEVELILLNSGSQGNVIRGLLQKGNVLDRVTFGGQVSQTELPRWYHMADLYISPSHIDGSSVSLMEALACGIPCLVSDIPANQEWIVENENGWLFRDGNVDDLMKKILAVLNQRAALSKIGQASRNTAEKRANWQKNSETLLNVYRHLVTKNRS